MFFLEHTPVFFGCYTIAMSMADYNFSCFVGQAHKLEYETKEEDIHETI